jgi:hypothetical protein
MISSIKLISDGLIDIINDQFDISIFKQTILQHPPRMAEQVNSNLKLNNNTQAIYKILVFIS